MRSLSATYFAFCDAVVAGCRRLTGSARSTGDNADLRRRLVGVLLASPVVIASAVAVVLSMSASPAALVISLCLVFTSAWLAGLAVAQHGHERIIGCLALLAGTCAAAVLVALGGGLNSPICLLLLALAFEPWWVWRAKRAAAIGCGAALAALVAAVAVGQFWFADALAVGWYWFPGVIYLGAVAARLTYRVPASPALTALELAMDAVVLRMTGNGDVTDVSQQSHRLLGLAPELLLNRALFDRLHVGDRVAYLCAISDVRAGAALRKAELRIRLPLGDDAGDGYRLLVAEFFRLSPDAADYVAVLREAPEIAELRAQLDSAQEEIERLGMAKSAFLASVSHELRTPLNAIIGFSDMLLHGLYGRWVDDRQRGHVALIRDAGDHLLGVVNSILDVSKLEFGAYDINPERFVLSDAVKMCASMMSGQASAKQINLETRIAPGVGELVADRRAVQQMLINLLSNAVKFTPAAGEITIGADAKGDRVEMWVKDTGMGIAAADMERLGKPFVQLGTDYARRHEGTGLGLALVKGLVKLHEGSMTVSSVLGCGTTVTIALPAAGLESLDMAAGKGNSLPQMKHGEIDGAYRKTA